MTAPTIPTSTVPAVRAFLLSALTAAITPDGSYSLEVRRGAPGTHQADDLVVVGDVVRTSTPTQMVGSGGAGWLWENYTLTVVVDIFRPGTEGAHQLAEDRAWALVAAIESVVRADPSLGALVVSAHPSQVRDTSSYEDNHKGRLVTANVDIAVEAQN